MPVTETQCLSVVVPCFNEEATLRLVVERVLASPYTAEVLIVDDGSSDRSREEADAVAARDSRVRVLRQPRNLGKGAALRRGFHAATSEYVIVQDADLEYDPADWPMVLEPLIDGRADVVYGSRFGSGGGARRVLYYWHAVGNRLLTFVSNAFTNLNLTDMETGYKAFRRDVIQSLDLREDGFGVEPEITGKLARRRARIYEVAISYDGRTYAQGKKIGWRDGMRALWCIVRYSRAGDSLIPRRERQPVGEEAADEELADVLASLESAEGYTNWVHGLLVDHLGDRILEVGAGHGTMTERLADHGHVTAVEPSERAAERLESRFGDDERIDIVCGTLSDCKAFDDFDAAVLVNVLEHVGDDVGLLAEIAQRLRPGGTVAVFVPAHDWLYSDFDRRIGHRRRYRLTSLAEVMDQAGLEVEELRYVNAPGALAWLGGVRLARLAPTPRLVSTYERLVLPAVARFEQDRTVPFGQSLVAVGRTPIVERTGHRGPRPNLYSSRTACNGREVSRSSTSREAILAATRQAIAARGPGKLTLSAVATTAGVSRPTLYRWFPTKDALLAALVVYEEEQFDLGLQAVVDAYRSPARRLDAALHYLVTYLDGSIGADPIGADPQFALRSLARSLPVQIDALVRLLGDAFQQVPAVRSGALSSAQAAELFLRVAFSHFLVPHPEPEVLLANLRSFAGLPRRSAIRATG